VRSIAAAACCPTGQRGGQNFTGASHAPLVDYPMGKQALFALAGFLGVCVSVPAQEIRDFGSNQPVKEQANFFGTLANAWNDPVPLQLADGRVFSFPSAFGWVKAPPAYYIPATPLAVPPRLFPITPFAMDSRANALSFLPVDYAGGEAGVFYGKSSGKFGREVTAGYIFGEVIDGNTHISVGASYEHTKGRVPTFLPR
jgi:hypothetical protein